MRAALGEVVKRHEVLRARLVSSGGDLWQEVEDWHEFELPVVDLSGLDDTGATLADTIAQAEAERKFDLGQGGLIRGLLVGRGQQEHELLVTMHHVVSDGWSASIFTRELAALYEAYRKGDSPKLPKLAVQYGDFAQWQREWLTGEVLEEQLKYWKVGLAGLEPLELPTDYPRPPRISHRGGMVTFRIGEELTGQLKQLCRREGVTLFMTLLAALDVLLWRYSGQNEYRCRHRDCGP